MALETSSVVTYCTEVTEISAAPKPRAEWQESLVRSKAQIAAGESVPLLPILDRLRASAERLEAQQGVTADGLKVNASR